MADWQTVPPDKKYWHPVNQGFSSTNAKFVCSQCSAEVPLPNDCGGNISQLGTSMGLPGVFCQQCGVGCISWTCNCGATLKTVFAFEYDRESITVRKRKFWD
jgi:DNA-directed RNA polymerase subunit RPC12/RpoP